MVADRKYPAQSSEEFVGPKGCHDCEDHNEISVKITSNTHFLVACKQYKNTTFQLFSSHCFLHMISYRSYDSIQV